MNLRHQVTAMVRESVMRIAREVMKRRRDLFKRLAEEHKYLKK